jgi:hypothetical protein
MNVDVMKDYKLRHLRTSHTLGLFTLGWSWNLLLFIIRVNWSTNVEVYYESRKRELHKEKTYKVNKREVCECDGRVLARLVVYYKSKARSTESK